MSQLWKRIILGFLMLVFLAVAAVLYLANHYLNDTSKLESLASGQLGRTVKIGAIDEIGLGSETTVQLRDISIANPVWASGTQLLSIESVRVHLDLSSLWADGPVVIRDLEIDGLRAELLAPEGREPSWVFDAASSSTAQITERDAGPVRLPVYFEQVHLSDSRVHYRDPVRDFKATLAGQLEGGDGIRLQLDGVAAGRPVDISGHTGRDGKAANLTVTGHVEGWAIDVNATLADPFAFTGLDLALQVTGDIEMAEGQASRALPLSVKLRVTGDGEKLVLKSGTLQSGASQIEAWGALGNLNTLDGMALSLSAFSPDLRELLPLPRSDIPAPLSLTAKLATDGSQLLIKDIAGKARNDRLRGDLLLELKEDFRGSRLTLDASGESIAELLEPWFPQIPADTHYDMDIAARWDAPMLQVEALNIKAGESKLASSAEIGFEGQSPSVRGRLKASGKRAHYLLRSLGLESPLPDDSFMLDGNFYLASSGELQLSDLDVQLGVSEMQGDVYIVPGVPVKLRAKLVAPKLDLRFLRAAPPAAASADKQRNYRDGEALTNKQLADQMIPENPIDFSWIGDYEGEVSLRADQLIYSEDMISQFELVAAIKEGVLATDIFEWAGDFSQGSAELKVRPLSRGAAIDFQLNSQRLPLLWLATGNANPVGKIDYKAELTTQGDTVAALAAASNGHIVLKGSGGRFDNAGMNLFFGDLFGEILSSIDPTSKQTPYTEVECQAGIIAIRDGVVQISPGLVVRTDKMDIGLGGSIDLNTERLDVVFNTRARKGVGISASKAVTPFVKLGGNFSHPRVGVNAKGVVVSGGMAVATGGISIVAEGMWDRWVATAGNPCEALFEQTEGGAEELRNIFRRPG
ncbi:AsmA family protein [Halioglobus maricola]|uniref:AsmA family protein n=1 Tax=Halioglobus maricola TaxID=2601894 RepID=A0A5P9NNL4_9GAMM|nr:AsmA-like C-terminal region-containing protein [Halioglobus maricola]QFU77372.1 AsmA family protein [Halioglobus maricola]